mmetsp:Transcript_48829/g.87932  ORF Transcript_48829/g.87932 Transcript_48829/m.87932 type:complete len:216 (-) Transcript_48829:26-673(-)
MAWSKKTNAFEACQQSFEGNILWIDRIKKERLRSGLDKPGKQKTTADVLYESKVKKSAGHVNVLEDWLPQERGAPMSLHSSLERPRPRLGSSSFAYGSYHVNHPDIQEAATRRMKETEAKAQKEMEQRRIRNLQIRYPVKWQRMQEQKYLEDMEREKTLVRSSSDPVGLSGKTEDLRSSSFQGTMKGTLVLHEGDGARKAVEGRLQALERSFLAH